MLVEYFGQMKDFANLQAGEFFAFFEEGATELGMRVVGRSPEELPHVMAFTLAAHASMTPPTVLNFSFQNRSVLSIPDAVVRTPLDLGQIHADSPPSRERPGPIIAVGGAILIRAYGREGTVDVNLATGGIGPARSHPGSTWVEDWQIVRRVRDKDIILCQRGKPAAS